MTLQQLRYVVEISRCGSITAAAQRLFIAQPSLSKAIRELESELGITIFERSRSGVIFTADGMELLGQARLILEQTTTLKERFSTAEKKERPCLSVSAQHYIFMIDAVNNMMNGFLQDYENYELRVRKCRTMEVIDDIVTQRSQLGVFFLSNTTERFMRSLLSKNEIEFTPLAEFGAHVYLRRSHPLARFPELTEEQLLPYPYVCYEQGEESQYYAEECVIWENTAKTVYVADGLTLYGMLQNTDSYTIGSGCLMPGITPEEVISIPLRNRVDRMQIGWIKLRGVELQPEMAEYVRRMEDSMQKCVAWNTQQWEERKTALAADKETS